MMQQKEAHKNSSGWPGEEREARGTGGEGGPDEARRQQFMNALRGAISETAVGPGGGMARAGDLSSHFTSTDCLEGSGGAFTEKFNEELRLIAAE